MRGLELRHDQVEVFGLLSTLRGRNPVRQTAGYARRISPSIPATPARECRADQVHSRIGVPPHRKSEPPVLATAEVREAMLATLPSLRAFALSLTNNRDAADDLVQDTILRAWNNIEKFEPGTNLQAWLFTILRNGFYSTYRKRQREVADPDGSYAGRLRSPPEQNARCGVLDVLGALEKVPADQRE